MRDIEKDKESLTITERVGANIESAVADVALYWIDQYEHATIIGNHFSTRCKLLEERIRELEVTEQRYSELLKLMRRAEKLALKQREEEEDRPRFRMDANGNLTRIEVEPDA